MASRKSKSPSPPPPKKARVTTVQATLHKFFSTSTGTVSRKHATIVKDSPSLMGLHMYSDKEIESSQGMDKHYKVFWNEQAVEMCREPALRDKLKDKTGFQAAINCTWTLKKSQLFEVQVQELQVLGSQLFDKEKFKRDDYLKTVYKHMDKVKELTQLCAASHDASEEEQDTVSQLLQELRKEHNALRVIIQRKKDELLSFISSEQLPTQTNPPEVYE